MWFAFPGCLEPRLESIPDQYTDCDSCNRLDRKLDWSGLRKDAPRKEILQACCRMLRDRTVDRPRPQWRTDGIARASAEGNSGPQKCHDELLCSRSPADATLEWTRGSSLEKW